MQFPRLIAFAATLSVLSLISATAGGASGTAETCGLPVAIQGPDIRAALARFEQTQSVAAAKACAHLRNAAAGVR